MMRTALLLACTLTALPTARAQSATVTGQVVLRDDGQPLGYTTIQAAEPQLVHKTGLVGALQESRSERGVNLHSTVYHLTADVVEFRYSQSHTPFSASSAKPLRSLHQAFSSLTLRTSVIDASLVPS